MKAPKPLQLPPLWQTRERKARYYDLAVKGLQFHYRELRRGDLSPQRIEKLAEMLRELLQSIGEDVESSGTVKTAKEEATMEESGKGKTDGSTYTTETPDNGEVPVSNEGVQRGDNAATTPEGNQSTPADADDERDQ